MCGDWGEPKVIEDNLGKTPKTGFSFQIYIFEVKFPKWGNWGEGTLAKKSLRGRLKRGTLKRGAAPPPLLPPLK